MSGRWGYQFFSEPKGWHIGAEGDMGRRFTATSCYFALASAHAFARYGGVQHMAETNGTVFCNINGIYYGPNGTKIPIDYSEYAKGMHDAELDAWGQALAAVFPMPQPPKPHMNLIVTWQHEPTINNAAQPKIGDWSGPAYVEAFRYCHDRIEAAAGRKLRWGFYPVVENYHLTRGIGKGTAYWPGDDVIDVIGCDLYYRGQRTYPQKVADLVAWSGAHGNKPLGIGELGDLVANASRPARLRELADLLRGISNLLHVNWNAKVDYGLGTHSGPVYDAWLGEHDGFD